MPQFKPNRDTRAYTSWYSMKARCDNPNHTRYEFYGGRGVTYCERWKDFDNFFEDMGEKPKGYQLDKEMNGGIGCKLYSPENCCWIPSSENPKHRRPFKKGPIDGKLPQERKDLIRQLYKDGHSFYSIEKNTGHHGDTIRKILSVNNPE